ncbi:MAG: hypothetical protein AAGB15_07185 [Pseudomonadota bacterium]
MTIWKILAVLPPNIVLTPVTATAIFVVAVLSGYNYRRIWKAEGPAWQLWVFGVIAAGCLLVLGFVPLNSG